MPIIYCKKVKVKGQNYLYRLLFQKKKKRKKERKKEKEKKRRRSAFQTKGTPKIFYFIYIYKKIKNK